MIRLRGRVEYQGGRTEEFAAGSTAFVAWEAYCRRQAIAEPYDPANVNTLNHYIAYAALGIPEGFDVWVKTVLDVESEAAGEEAQVPPTRPEPSTEAWSNSPSP